ncbi:MAG: hypothetical protein M5U28_42095 [Sandaracinaceae bacterium]|nr:hypothetical protein [Sandaracinaceae bacterium]
MVASIMVTTSAPPAMAVSGSNATRSSPKSSARAPAKRPAAMLLVTR